MKKWAIDFFCGVSTRIFGIRSGRRQNQDGSAMVIAMLIMILLLAFVALALSRTSNETIAASNDEAETKTFEAANASLEILTRNFNKIFETKLTIAPSDVTRIQGQTPPVFDTLYGFNQVVTQTQTTQAVVMTGQMFQGLNAWRDEWELDTTATDNVTGVQVALRRKFYNNRIPIFQFGIFYDNDLEFHPGPIFDFGGRVHSNGSIFLMAQSGLYFQSKVTAAQNIYTDISKNGSPYTNWGENVFVKNASGTYVQLLHTMGSVLANPVNGSPVSVSPEPTAYKSANWAPNSGQFQGNLLANQTPLQLPIKLNSDLGGLNLDLVEVIKRGKELGDVWNDGSGTVASPALVPVTSTTMDDKITAADRYYNKTGIRVSIADNKVKLPGCATSTGTSVSTPCGIRLDGESTGQTEGAIGAVPRGYQPVALNATTYQATKINGDRFYTGPYSTGNKETWIKIETVVFNAATQNYDTNDITQDILALGVTDAPPNNSTFSIADANYNTNAIDSRSIFDFQRFVIPGPAIGGTGTYASSVGSGATAYNYVNPGTVATGKSCKTDTLTTTGADTGTITGSPLFFPSNFAGDNRLAMRNATISGISGKVPCVVPFPIEMFDTREGLYNDTSTVFNPTGASPGYGSNVPWAGVMSMVDVDINNLRTFLNGTWDANMPNTTPYHTATGHVLRSTDIPQNNGWVVYVSDRRGDYDFDGEYDMEDVYGNNDGILEPGEDINNNGTLQADYVNEAVKYTGTGSNVTPDIAAVFDHKFNRRGVRLVNGSLPPGNYDSVTPANTRGFTFASENGVYVLGDYNASGSVPAGTPTASNLYPPQGANDIPASIAADAITILSNSWNDAESFVYPFSLGNRNSTVTTGRFGMIAGNTITTLAATPNQGGGDLNMNGGVHNFLRFLENWGTNYNYTGSLINLYHSHNNNGPYKCCNNVYSPPTRNWTFDVSFTDPDRLPPGTPYFQNITMTGFQRVN